MTLNVIVIAISLLMIGFFLAWILFPQLRPFIEAPKYRVFDWENRFPVADRSGTEAHEQPRDVV